MKDRKLLLLIRNFEEDDTLCRSGSGDHLEVV